MFHTIGLYKTWGIMPISNLDVVQLKKQLSKIINQSFLKHTSQRVDL